LVEFAVEKFVEQKWRNALNIAAVESAGWGSSMPELRKATAPVRTANEDIYLHTDDINMLGQAQWSLSTKILSYFTFTQSSLHSWVYVGHHPIHKCAVLFHS
jgi:hypothetical protein